jgi:hypothetical protein
MGPGLFLSLLFHQQTAQKEKKLLSWSMGKVMKNTFSQ